MSEYPEPQPSKGGFVDTQTISDALRELAYMSDIRREAHGRANLFRDLHVNGADNQEHGLRRQLDSAQGVLARWALLATNQEFRAMELAYVQNDGDWDSTGTVEEEIGDLAVDLFVDGEIDGMVDRHTSEAKLRVTVDPGLLSASGLVVIRRKRLMFATRARQVGLRDARPRSASQPPRGPLVATSRIELDKASEFILDVERFGEVGATGAEIIAEGLMRGRPFDIARDEELRQARQAVEAAIDERHPSLIPASTVYYAERSYSGIREAGTADALAGSSSGTIR